MRKTFLQAFEFFRARPGMHMAFASIYFGLYLAVSLLGLPSIVSNVVSLAVLPWLYMGFSLAVKAQQNNPEEAVPFSVFFEGAKKALPLMASHFLQSLVLASLLVMTLLPFVDLAQLNLLSTLNPNDTEALAEILNQILTQEIFFALLAGLVLVLVFSALFIQTPFIILFENQGVLSAIKQSFQRGAPHLTRLMGWMILYALLFLSGFFFFFIGLLVTVPVAAIAEFLLYQQLRPTNLPSSSDESF